MHFMMQQDCKKSKRPLLVRKNQFLKGTIGAYFLDLLIPL